MKHIIMLILITLMVGSNALAVDINELYINPAGSEYELEFVELYSDTEVDVGGWFLNTSYSEHDATLPEGLTIPAGGHILIADSGFGEAKPADWPNADYEEPITLTNSGGYVQLCSPQGPEAFVEWNEPAPESKSLTLTGNNYTFTAPSPESQVDSTQSMDIELIVEGSPLKILNLSIEDEAPEMAGIQIFPSPGKTKQKPIQLKIEGEADELSISFNNKELGNVSQIDIPFSLQPGLYSLEAVACSGVDCYSSAVSVEIMEVIGFELDTNKISLNSQKGSSFVIAGDLDLETPEKPSIMNSGNVPITLKVTSTGLMLGNTSIPKESISIQTDASEPFYELSNPFTFPLGVLSTAGVSIQFELPGDIPKGSYNGKLLFSAQK